MSNKVIEEQDLRKSVMGGLPTNATTNNLMSNEGSAQKAAVETALTIDGYKARVITWLGDYVKIKWFKDNKLFTTYKAKDTNDVSTTPSQYLSDMREIYEPGYVPPTPETPAP